MYVEIKENKLLSWCEHPYLNYEFVDIDYSTFNPEKYEVKEGKLVDISQTQEFKDSQALKEKQAEILKIKSLITELENTQSRAMREMLINPNDFAKNKLEEIDSQISALRQQFLVL